jgi:L-lactate utilization protein LutC
MRQAIILTYFLDKIVQTSVVHGHHWCCVRHIAILYIVIETFKLEDIMRDFSQIVSDEAIGAAVTALEANGFTVTIAANAAAAKDSVLTALPNGAEVFTTTSETLDATGIAAAINDTGDYDAVRPKLASLTGEDSKQEQRRLGSAPAYVVGSVHAVTQDGRVLVASATGSQLPSYVYGAGTVIWVVGAQKIVENMDEALARLEQYVFPLENKRAMKAYGSGSSINKVLMVNKEFEPGRIQVVIVKESLGF